MLTEKQKMLAGQAYDAWDPELLKERMHAKNMCHQFNMSDPTKPKARMALLKRILNFKGSGYMEPNFFCDYGYNITLGDNFYANHNLTILDVCAVTIGDNVFVAPHVLITSATHPIDPIERQSTEYGEPIVIGDNVWIGGNVTILPGVTIGDNTTIGGGSVVTKDIPANVVAVGNPCRVLKSIE